MDRQRSYIAIDLKSFYASVECMERGLDPMTTNLVVADLSRTEKTICLAVSPALKQHGISGRARLFEVIEQVKTANARRRQEMGGRPFAGSSADDRQLKAHPELAIDYIVAPPRMAKYIEISSLIHEVYLKYIAPEDMHVYSIDEVFIDATSYLEAYKLTARELAMKMILDVLSTTGITATAGVGANLYLCKIAMDIMAKHIEPDENGVRIAELDEMSYRRLLWDHRPLTDFWRVGRGYAKKLESYGLYTMGDVARCSVGREDEAYNEALLYRLFGVNAELLIDHAWGWEDCTIADIKAYRPQSNSLSSGQVLQCPYDFRKARVVTREMTDLMVLDLVGKGLVTDQIVLTIGYDIENLTDPERCRRYKGEITVDPYGRRIPKHAHGSVRLRGHSASTEEIMAAVEGLYDRICDPALLVRRITLAACNIVPERSLPAEEPPEQMDLFTDYDALERNREQEKLRRERERRRQKAIIGIREKYGKNAMLRGMNFEEGATARERNRQVGGHRA